MKQTIKTHKAHMKIKDARKSRVVVALKRDEPAPAPVTLPEFHLRKILVPIDFSESSRKALNYAISFARQFNSEIHLLHVVETVIPVSPDIMGRIMPLNNLEPAETGAARRLAAWREEIATKTSARAFVRSGMPSQTIVETAEEYYINLIIMGHRGRTGLAHLLLGGTAEYVLRHAPCPALVVRETEYDFISAEEPAVHRLRTVAFA
jgi:universal stress protein A